jgi:hypothetical protein
MKKYYIILPIFLIASLLVTGCSKKNEQNSNEQDNQNQEQQAQENQMPRWDENFEEANLDDLETGQQALVMGTENSDGSISASQIMIGDEETDFENMGGLMRPAVNSGQENQDDNNQPIQPPAGFKGQRGNFEQIQNISEEERMKLMEEMRARRQANGGSFPLANMRSGGMTRMDGKIIDKDDTTITLKIEAGGSKLIFYSEETKILKFKIDNTELKEEGVE